MTPSSPMRYRLLGIDVDGTLLGPDHQVAPEVIGAVARARASGLRICLATGRTYVETIDIWRRLRLTGPFEPIILIGGALVCEPDTARTLFARSIPRELACEFADALGEEGYSAMAVLDAWRHGWDYVLCETGDVHSAQRNWLDKMKVRVRRVGRLCEAADMPRPLRIHAVVESPAAARLEAAMKERFDGRLNIHAIVAPNYGVTIVEGFAAEVDKFNALKYVAQGYRISLRAVAAVGDDVNDLGMIRGAALGVAMPNASGPLREAADCVARRGLADFIDRLAAGQFDEGEYE